MYINIHSNLTEDRNPHIYQHMKMSVKYSTNSGILLSFSQE